MSEPKTPYRRTFSREFALLALAGVSGVPALVYQVVWVRETALWVGGQTEAVALVVAAFFWYCRCPEGRDRPGRDRATR